MHAPTRISIGSRRLGEFTILAPSEKTCVSCQVTWEKVFTQPASLFVVERYIFSWPCMHTCTLQNTCVNAVQQENSLSITNACAQKRVRRCSRQAYASKVLFALPGNSRRKQKIKHAHMSELRARTITRSITRMHTKPACIANAMSAVAVAWLLHENENEY